MDEMLKALNKLSIETTGCRMTEQEIAFCRVAYQYGKVDGSKEMARKQMEIFK